MPFTVLQCVNKDIIIIIIIIAMSILVFLTLPKLLTESTLQLSYVQETILLRDVSIIVVHIICFCYQSQHMCLQCSNTKLSFSTISNGVRQGGILSTKLFSVYMDDLSIC